ncbi:MAG: T9SS type B sorting domain-containing protein, partial [Bacteroidia bacterium]
ATSTVQNPYYFYNSGGTHTIILIATNSDGCKDTAQQVINVGVPPPVAVSAATNICIGSSVQLDASGGINYQWTPTVSLQYANTSGAYATPSVTTIYSVAITATNGCVFLLTTTVNVSQYPSGAPIAATADPPYVITGNNTTLIYLGPPGSLITWLPIGSTTPTSGYTVTAMPDRPTTYTVVVTTGACSQRTTVHVDAYSDGCIDKDVYIPNTFTPNSDGHNDLFMVRGLKVQELYFAVYNRWGEMVFETNDKTKGWDGIYKGRPADIGVFGWYLKVKCFNGEETFRKGNVTLIR